MVPFGGVEYRPFECLDTLDIGFGRVMQNASTIDDKVSNDSSVFAGCDRPFAFFINTAGDAVFSTHPLKVSLNFVPVSVAVAPVGIRFKGIGLHVGGDITGHSRVGVFSPGTAEPIGFFQNRQVGNAGFTQFDGKQNYLLVNQVIWYQGG